MQLNQLQLFFKQVILNPDWLEQTEQPERLLFKNDAGVSLKNRVNVYRNNVIQNLVGAARSALPNTEKMIGSDCLSQALEQYAQNNLPQEGNLNLYGLTFSDFLQHYAPTQHLSFLPCLARLEFLIEQARYAKDDYPLNRDALSHFEASQFAQLQFQFRHAVGLYHSAYPILNILDLCDAYNSDKNEFDKLPDEHTVLQHQEATQMNHDNPCTLLVYREQLEIKLVHIEYADFLFLQALQQNQTILEAAQTVADHDQEIDITKVLQKALKYELFTQASIRS